MTLAIKNWKTYQLSKQLVYFPGEVFCEFLEGVYRWDPNIHTLCNTVFHIADQFAISDDSF